MKIQKNNWFNSIIYFFYRYYLKKNDTSPSSYALMSARIATIAFLFILSVPFQYFIDNIFHLNFFDFIVQQNRWVVGIIIVVPIYILMSLFSLKLKDVEEIEKTEYELFRKKGRKNFIIVLMTMLFLWAIRFITFK